MGYLGRDVIGCEMFQYKCLEFGEDRRELKRVLGVRFCGQLFQRGFDEVFEKMCERVEDGLEQIFRERVKRDTCRGQVGDIRNVVLGESFQEEVGFVQDGDMFIGFCNKEVIGEFGQIFFSVIV